jgi:phosphoglycerate kinase
VSIGRIRTLADLPGELRGRNVLVRVDFNVPVDAAGHVTDDTRLRAALPTLEWLTARGARVAVVSHFGRPKGAPDPRYSLAPVAAHFATLAAFPVAFFPETDTEAAVAATRALGEGEVLVLENTRFLAGEETNDAALAQRLAALGEVFVNDAFGAAHRAHASTVGVAGVVTPAVAGLLMARELEYLGTALATPKRPFVAVLGGSKISGKIDVIEALLPKVDALLIGGAMACTFYRALGLEVGTSLVEPDRVEMAAALIERSGTTLILPHDALVAPSIAAASAAHPVRRDQIPASEAMLDIGPETAASYARAILAAKTVLWNGPMGVFEHPPLDHGTSSVARAMAEATRRGATTIVGGGDSAAAVAQAGLSSAVSHVSTGGGASLEFLEGRTLPGVAALDVI